ncbi:hypothetical protein TTHERM_00471640 (macronuclear) [Tetrahymena thermophila SB210]|uniref:Uncharacterized protein n=1 Tax=Tetrahymena thermophila (strain SB210) TaxID=312017 RepID=I7LTJ9_TETTS|nr:hypothetical protein TTHERM_00471640 [Tetrahymena thermophila SB210]EAR85385.2 hypothetical protein TTHERM_00471640 [Tetrahymena thermophila SB210]|eukprot:XP_001033048.2 hypothetical protein TTHERM_00471640 [Tetrahymena thermophila SB210]
MLKQLYAQNIMQNYSSIDYSQVEKNQRKCQTQMDSNDEEEYSNEEGYYGRIQNNSRKKSKISYNLKKKFLDEEKESNDETDFHLPQLKDNRYYNSLQNEQRYKRNKSVQPRNQYQPIDQKEKLIVKNTQFEEQVSQYIPHRNHQKSFDNYQYFKEYYNDEEPQPISTKKPKTRQVSFYDNNQSAPQMNLKSINPIKSKSQIASPFINQNNQNYLILQEQYRNSIDSLQQIKINQLKQRQLERNSQNIEELEEKKNYEFNNNNKMNFNQQEQQFNDDSSETINYSQFEEKKQGSIMKIINDFSEIELKPNQRKPITTSILEKNSNLNKIEYKSPQLSHLKQRSLINNPIIEISATDSLKAIQTSSQDEKSYIFKDQPKRQSINQNRIEFQRQQNLDKLNNIQLRNRQQRELASQLVSSPQKISFEIPETNKSSIVANFNILQSRREQSSAYQQYHKQEYSNQRNYTPIKKPSKTFNQSPNQYQPISDYSIIKKLEQSSPVLKQLKQLDKHFEQEQKENQDLISKMNEWYLLEMEEKDLVNKSQKPVKQQSKSPAQIINKQYRINHLANFSNINKIQKRKSSREALQLDIPKKEQKELESILQQLKSYSKIMKKQKKFLKNQENLD